MIENKDHVNWVKKMSVEPVDDEIKKITLPRPGHADLAGINKFISMTLEMSWSDLPQERLSCVLHLHQYVKNSRRGKYYHSK